MNRHRTVLLVVGNVVDDDDAWRRILERYPGKPHRVSGCGAALSFLSQNHVPVVLCERDLPDGTWRDVVEPAAVLDYPPAVIVTSRLADDRLWLEVLNAGGYDVLVKPFDCTEARRTLASAWHHATHANLADASGRTL